MWGGAGDYPLTLLRPFAFRLRAANYRLVPVNEFRKRLDERLLLLVGQFNLLDEIAFVGAVKSTCIVIIDDVREGLE